MTLVRVDFTVREMIRKPCHCCVTDSARCPSPSDLYLTTGSSQLFPWCQTYILSKETADRATCCSLCGSPCVSPLFLLHWGFSKSAGREPGAHHFNAVQNRICIIICKPYVREASSAVDFRRARRDRERLRDRGRERQIER